MEKLPFLVSYFTSPVKVVILPVQHQERLYHSLETTSTVEDLELSLKAGSCEEKKLYVLIKIFFGKEKWG